MATLINIGNNIKVNPKFISYFEGLEIVLANKHRFTVSAEVIELVKAYVENRNTGALHYKGKVSSVSNLPSTGNIDGDMYLVTGEDKYYAWNGTSWDDTPTIVNISSLQSSLSSEVSRAQAKEAELEEAIADQNEEIADFKETITDQVNNYQPVVIEGDVTNAADEEDLTSDGGLLKIKNRSALNGMGYVILRRGTSFAEQVIQTNTIYEIRYNFDLDGTEVTIPEGCTLKFEGGKLTNGVISSNKLKIEGILGCFNEVIFSNSTTFTSDINLAWFVKNDGSQEVSEIANNIIKIASLSMVRVKVKSGIYNIANPILLYHNTYIEGSVSSDRQGAKFVWVGDKYTPFVGKQTNQYDMFAYNDYGNSSRAEMVCIKNLFIDGNSKARVGINVSHIVYSAFEYIFIRNTTMAYVYGHSSINGSFTTPCIYNKFENIFGWSTKLTDAETQYVCRFGFRLQSQVNACTFISCRAGNCDTGFALEDNIDVDGETFNSTLNWHSNQNQFISCASEGEVIGLYINSEYNTFIGHRFEGVRDFDLYFPELEGSDNRQRNNIFICPTVFGGSSVPNNEPYNVLKPNNVYLGCSWWNEDHTRFEMSKFKNVYSDILDTNKIYGTNAFLSSAEIDNIAFKHITATNFIQLRGQGQSKTLAKFSCNWITDGERFRLQTISPEGTTHTLLNSSTAPDSVFDFVSPIKVVNYNQVSDIPLTINGGNNAQNIIFMLNGNIAWKTNNIVYTPIYKPADNNSSGTTAQRPTTNIEIGFQYFDTDLGKPIYWTGAKWVDANGADLT